MIDVKNILQATNNQVEKDYSKIISLEHRKKFAQFFTPFQLASLMADWLLGNQELKTVLEPAFGLGVFTRALIGKKSDLSIKGFDIEETILPKQKIFSRYTKLGFTLGRLYVQ
jgi:adenine-specific DNA-methyltransferase